MDLFQFLRQNLTPLQKLENAVKKNDLTSLEDILSQGIDPNITLTKYGGDTALHFAARSGFFKCIQILIEHGANPDKSNDSRISPLFDAVRTNHCKAALELLRHVNDVKTIEDLWLWDSRVPSYFWSTASDELIAVLLKATPCCDSARENLRKNLFSICVSRKFYKTLKYWIYCGNSVDSEQKTELDEALKADPTVQDSQDQDQKESEETKAEFRQWLTDFRRIPSSLQFHCCIAIRKSFLGNCNVFRGVRDLTLPEPLRNKVCFII